MESPSFTDSIVSSLKALISAQILSKESNQLFALFHQQLILLHKYIELLEQRDNHLVRCNSLLTGIITGSKLIQDEEIVERVRRLQKEEFAFDMSILSELKDKINFDIQNIVFVNANLKQWIDLFDEEVHLAEKEQGINNKKDNNDNDKVGQSNDDSNVQSGNVNIENYDKKIKASTSVTIPKARKSFQSCFDGERKSYEMERSEQNAWKDFDNSSTSSRTTETSSTITETSSIAERLSAGTETSSSTKTESRHSRLLRSSTSTRRHQEKYYKINMQESGEEIMISVKKFGKENSKRARLTVNDREYNPDQHCGVVDDGVPCKHLINCKFHRIDKRRAVQGRSKPFDQLMKEYHERLKNRH